MSNISTQYSARSTQHSALSTQHSTLSTQHAALNTQHSARSTQHSTLSTQSWLITDDCGFPVTSLIKRLLQEGVPHIRVLDNLTVGTREDLATVCNFTEVQASSLLFTPHS